MLPESKFSLYLILPLSWTCFQGYYCRPFGSQAIYKNSPLNSVDAPDTKQSSARGSGITQLRWASLSLMKNHHISSGKHSLKPHSSVRIYHLPCAIITSRQWEMTLNTLSGIFSLEVNKERVGRHRLRARLYQVQGKSSPRRAERAQSLPSQEIPSSHNKATVIKIRGSTERWGAQSHISRVSKCSLGKANVPLHNSPGLLLLLHPCFISL